MAETICKRVCYSGRVQGVGFRYSTCRIAERFAVSGYVKNLPDGTVEMLVEGEPTRVDAFMAALAEEMKGYIRNVQESQQSSGAGYQGFRVVY